MDLDSLRRDYKLGGLKHSDLAESPFEQFDVWLKQAIDSGIHDPTAMTLATVNSDGQPSQRIVLLKQADRNGFVFFTNYGSQKASEMKGNPFVSLHLPWHMLERQVRVCGRAEKTSVAESMEYFLSRPEQSQLAAWASKQSRPVSSRQLLMQQFNAMKDKFKQGSIPLPDFWGGFRVIPESIEFWQGGESRLHDRFRYTKDGDNWTISRLAP